MVGVHDVCLRSWVYIGVFRDEYVVRIVSLVCWMI